VKKLNMAGDKLKVKCPVCGIEGFLEQRGNNYRIKHYQGYNGNQRQYSTHKISRDYTSDLGINGNKRT
jgi:hypothetical protein